MEYIAAIRKPWENIDLYLALGLLSFIPIANIYVLGYLLDFCKRDFDEPKKMLKRFVAGSKLFALFIIYLFLPVLSFYLLSIKAALFFSLILFPPFTLSIYALSRKGLEEALEIDIIKKAYSPKYLAGLVSICIISLLSLTIHLLLPIVGWIGIAYGPAATFMYMLGSLGEMVYD